MYCPKCGQPQASDELRFCSRCGLALSGLPEWLTSNGGVARALELQAVSPRKKGITRGAKVIFASAVLTPFFLGVSFLIDEPFPLFIPFTLFLAGLSLLIYSSIFGDEASPEKSQVQQQTRLRETFGTNALPPASDFQVNSVGRRDVRTAELAQPASVTENTTKLLDRDS